MKRIHDLFHQTVYANKDFTIESDYTGIFPQHFVYWNSTDELIGTTNGYNFMGTCRIIMNEYRKQKGLPKYNWKEEKER